MLWTRLAQNPLADNGHGGMPDRPFLMEWEIATDKRFCHTVGPGIEVARPKSAHSVHVEVEGYGRETTHHPVDRPAKAAPRGSGQHSV
ncbi:phosphodiesterase/alkaline phosphatase D-like protein [Kibdelosporangium banguiense]|uniref:Phosphodiesterase/alkaline phosphatase D-like protein n=1 Tax=Kibdelosporangium banguiense TaxID=1365924 RepID=A0ABS4TW05_9PSEU|nr:PhoD-like phosphatase N-terminal domain-containing protein [Kibdelosporangium banguiense]MBP2328579.1 phosphodiesterase/alkaline phosphatase D-like protein [Kibdelosporangium banguiense]